MDNTNKQIDIFMAGWFIGLVMAILIVVFSYEPKTTFESKVKLIPDYRLEANGKVVDTVFIYKIKD